MRSDTKPAAALTVSGNSSRRPVKRCPAVAGLPFAHPASAAELLENAAWAAGKKVWTTPRPDQFMYKEIRELHNSKELQDKASNGPLVPGKTRVVVEQDWKRIDAQVWSRMSDGKLVVEHQGAASAWAQIPYGDLAKRR